MIRVRRPDWTLPDVLTLIIDVLYLIIVALQSVFVSLFASSQQAPISRRPNYLKRMGLASFC
jgi:hypothetical protein